MESFECLVGFCKKRFGTRSHLQHHYAGEHSDPLVEQVKEDLVRQIVPEDIIKKIVPDQEFLTMNTKDLEEMLKALPEEAFYAGKKEFQDDFDTILNEKVEIKTVEPGTRFRCNECKFKASSQRALRAHLKFVHETTFFKCKHCKMRTKTADAMQLHLKRVHDSDATYKQVLNIDESNMKKDKIMTLQSDSSEFSDEESSDSDFNDIPDLYIQKKWKNGWNFKS